MSKEIVGLVNPFTNTKFVLTKDMLEFFNGYLLEYKDLSDIKIAKEFSKKFDILLSAAYGIERDYVAFNRNRIYLKINNYLKAGLSKDETVEFIMTDFGLNRENAKKYVQRSTMDGLDNFAGLFAGKKRVWY